MSSHERTPLSGTEPQEMRVTLKQACADQDPTYETIGNTTTVVPGTWSLIEGSFSLVDCSSFNEVLVIVEGLPGEVDLYLDEVNVIEVIK